MKCWPAPGEGSGDNSESSGFDTCKRWFGASEKPWAEMISLNFSHLSWLKWFLASLCLQEMSICFGHPHLCVGSPSWDPWVSRDLQVALRGDTGHVGDPCHLEWHLEAEQDALLHFKRHQMLLSRVGNWILPGEAIPPACFRHLFQYGLGEGYLPPRTLWLDAWLFSVVQVRQDEFNSTFCVIPYVFLAELVWSRKSFRSDKSSQKRTSE